MRLGLEHVAGAQDVVPARDVRGAAADVLPRVTRRRIARPRRAVARRLFDHDDGVGAGRHRRAGRDLDALAGPIPARRRPVAGEDAIDAACSVAALRAGAERVGGDHRVAVHRRAIERRHVHRRRRRRARRRGRRRRQCDTISVPRDRRPLRRCTKPQRFSERRSRAVPRSPRLLVSSSTSMSFRQLRCDVAELGEDQPRHRQAHRGLRARQHEDDARRR